MSDFSEYIIEIPDSKSKVLAENLEIKLLISDMGVNHDSAILIKTKEFTFLNQNDCKVFDRLNEIKEEVDFYSVQFSGATRHPPSYLTSPRRKEKLSYDKTIKKLDNVVKGIRELAPKYYLPAAGPAFSISRRKSFIWQWQYIYSPRLFKTLLRAAKHKQFCFS